MKYDLHVHSNISDGKFSREDIFKLAKKENLEYFSFIEHNKYQEFISDDKNIKILNGIEFDCQDILSFHLLVYFNKLDNSIIDLINMYDKNVTSSSMDLINNIKKIYNIDICINKYPITKRDIIDYLINNNYAKSVNEASGKYTGKGSLSYVKKYSLSFDKFKDLDKNNVSLVLAHPNTLLLNDNDIDMFISYLKVRGLDGIEVYNSSKTDINDINKYLEIANKYKLITTSGSDYHGKNNDKLGVDNDYSKVLIKKHFDT